MASLVPLPSQNRAPRSSQWIHSLLYSPVTTLPSPPSPPSIFIHFHLFPLLSCLPPLSCSDLAEGLSKKGLINLQDIQRFILKGRTICFCLSVCIYVS